MIVVGVGAGASGYEALRTLLAEAPAGADVAFVVLLGGDDPGALASGTAYRVRDAEHGDEIRPGHVYLAPPHKLIALEQGVLRLEPADPDARRAPIDQFLQSLARDRREHAVAVVLAGLDSDGALGLKAVSDAGGMTIVQDPGSAPCGDVPQGVLDTGGVDHVLPPERIAGEIDAYGRHVRERADNKDLQDEILRLLPEICEVLLRETGHDFKHYKTSTVLRRTLRRVQVLRLGSAHEYLERLRADGAEAQRLFKDLLVSVTAFFRDPAAFDALASDVLRRILEGRSATEPVRIWVPGCATGEEAYTIGMLVKEQLEGVGSPPPVQIFATDIDEHALSVARQGIYPAGIAAELTPDRLKRFFVRKGEQYHVTKELRELCLFSVHNLINDPPFSKLDLISCRNLLIYLGAHLQKKLIPLFHFALRSGGSLFLGPSENLAGHRELFRPLDTKHRISQRLPTAIKPAHLLPGRGAAPTAPKPPNVPTSEDLDVYLVMQRIILDEFAPKGVVVDEAGKIYCAAGNLERFLTVSAGVFQNNVVRLARDGVRVALRAALSEAAKHRRRAAREALLPLPERRLDHVEVIVQPMPQLGEDAGLFLVVFKDLPASSSGENPRGGSASSGEAATLIEHLERELESTRGDLEKTVQELEGANEELKSSNEELLSMNEELQSANEELQTSKDEVQAGNDLLVRANDDLENLLTSTQIATIFLDNEQKIRRVTAPATEIYNIRPEDHSRPLSDFTHKAKAMPPLPSPQAVLRAAKAIEHEVELADGRTFLRRVMPYTTQHGNAEGTVVAFIDITERREVENRLRASEGLYRAIGESIDYGVWVCEPSGRNVYASESFLKLVGLTQEECSGFGWGSVLHPDDGERTLSAWRECVRTGGTWDIEHRFRGVDGHWHAILARGVPVRDEQGNITCWAGINLDISRQKRIEAELRASEERFRLVADAAPVLIWISDLDKQITWLNKRWLDFTGRTLADELGTGWLDAVHQDDRRHVLDAYEAAFEKRISFMLEYRLRRHDGEFRWVLDHGVPLQDEGGRFLGYIGSCVDNHDQKHAERALRDSEERFRTLADSAAVRIWVDGLDGREYVNREYLRFAGTGPEGVRGWQWVQTLHPDDAPAYLAAYRQAFERGERWQAQGRMRRHDGEYRWIHTVALPRYDGRGKFAGYVGCSTDVTDIKRAEETLLEADRRKDEFLAMLAHELRNPLAAVVNANLVAARSESDPQTRQWAHQVIERQARQLTRLVDDLLDLSRISSGKIRLQKQPVDASQVLQRAVESMRRHFEQKGQTVTVDLPQEPLPVDADPARLEQVLMNLLTNANKYTQEQGSISISGAREKELAVLRVRDTGIGIAPDLLPRVFEAFTQADSSPDRAGGGLGLGLTVVKHLVEEHGGFVRAHSAGPGRGSEFVIGLPLHVGSESHAGLTEQPAPAAAPPRKIMLVEDNADTARTLSMLLEHAGHHVTVLHDGREAVETARTLAPDVVLLDLGLPGLDGYAVAKALRAAPSCAHCTIIAISGYGQERDRRRSRDAGIDQHLVKPVELGKLLALLSPPAATN